jgi:hypothetical protein
MSLVDPQLAARYSEAFSRRDNETVVNAVSNAAAPAWMCENVPLFECPDESIVRTYYYRWWTYRKHIRQTPAGFVVTEFLPEVGWSGKYNTIGLAAGHHLYEGRWLRNPAFLDDYSRFWFSADGAPHMYSCWLADAIHALHLATGDAAVPRALLPALVANFEQWEAGWPATHALSPWWRDGVGRLGEGGLFWQVDSGCDGMEFSIGGGGYRPTLNAYLFGDARAISRMAELAGEKAIAARFATRAAEIKRAVQARLWDPAAAFFKTRAENNGTRYDLEPWYAAARAAAPVYAPGRLVDVREQVGFIPWYFNLPDPGYEEAWRQLRDPGGFAAPYGLTTAERRHPSFMYEADHMCLWNGPVWPFATSQTLTALANVLNNYDQQVVGRRDYFNAFLAYTRAHVLRHPDGTQVPWIDENQDPFTGDWLARRLLHARRAPDRGRGACYNHSTYCDLVVTGIMGLRPRADDVVLVNPLAPLDDWAYSCLDRIPYHGSELAIAYDRTGDRYGLGPGLHVLQDGRLLASARRPCRIKVGMARRRSVAN